MILNIVSVHARVSWVGVIILYVHLSSGRQLWGHSINLEDTVATGYQLIGLSGPKRNSNPWYDVHTMMLYITPMQFIYNNSERRNNIVI